MSYLGTDPFEKVLNGGLPVGELASIDIKLEGLTVILTFGQLATGKGR